MTTTTITDSAPPGGVGGMLNRLGGRFGGYGLYLVKGIRKPNLMAVTLLCGSAWMRIGHVGAYTPTHP